MIDVPARLAYPFLYHTLTSPLSEDGRDRIDAILGNDAAKARVNTSNLDVIMAAGGGVA